MQRSAASPTSSPGTPAQPPSKKQRLSNGSYNSTPASTPRSDTQAVEDALAEEERVRQEVLEREGRDRGETKWYLSFKEPAAKEVRTPLRIVSAGYSMLDVTAAAKDRSSKDDNEHNDTPTVQGRRNFGNFSRKSQVRCAPPRQRSSLLVCAESKQAQCFVRVF